MNLNTTFRFTLKIFFSICCIHATGQESRTNNDSLKKTNSSISYLDSVNFIPVSIGFINDYAQLFSKEEIGKLEGLVYTYEKRTSVEIVVATILDSMMGPIDFEPYTLLMLNTWGVGKKDKKNGILIAIAPELRTIRVQNGYGIERILTNEKTKEIIDKIFVPKFREGKFFEGTRDGIQAIILELDKEK